MYLIDFFVEPLQYTFIRRALLVTVVASVVCAVLSCWLVLIGWSLMGDAVSHAVLPGVALSYLLGAPFAIGALLFALVAVGTIGLVRNTTLVKEDAAIGVVFTTLFALGVVLVSKFPSQIDLNHILFGNLLGVSQGDMWQVLVLGGIALVVMVAKRRDFTLFAFDRTQARAVGISPTVVSGLMLTLLALTTVVALQAVGVILVVAMLITPGATAYLLTHRFGRMLVLAPSIGVACAVVGIYVSFYLDVSSGGTVVLAQGIAFTLAYLFSPTQGMVTRRLRRRRVISDAIA
ncbi:metal ABC transporter permease [Rhodococcus sp. BP-252]|uniref:metal ABC transporter permease n=1 Tax=unclassified Rhodococcus (in: high G+C Gram-positive bacteria) TaxID=192944 RepID=UPI001C9ACE4C|nr:MULTISPECIES: metal ABC transporter permease [unclassified Rhodococcus (in: high G+C Gram-positive bacteria)]MBY6411060.1 metal ABC transporter permease [Rhodococcus sp. BP-320]MBY6415719.1 metal ABC transporter permease [Rhodococcus sp. BP-321]MBY6420899.1 metal ABC transporter permease [Rhodococcus sp. BP-324]MBY6425954.1 metal ABC transporter permease [Rhodococcus sp. BP-323]MBY6430925.1 metal ABC transporter permease [Rhodococcus sp. BP-322]